MTIEETREAAEVMLYQANGGEVECRDRDDKERWRSIACPSWNWEVFAYRKKPEPNVIWLNHTTGHIGFLHFDVTEETLRANGYTRYTADPEGKQ